MKRVIAVHDNLVRVSLVGGDWDGHYRVETHGKTDVEIVAEVEKWQSHHTKKAARLTSFHSNIVGSTVTVGGKTFTFTDCTIREHGTDVELYVAVDHRPLPTYHATIDDLPTDEEIIARVTAIITTEHSRNQTHADKIANVKKLLGV